MKNLVKEFIRILKVFRKDYKNNSQLITKRDKKICYKKVFNCMVVYVWNMVSAPFIYPIWYLFRKKITDKIYRGTSCEEINELIGNNQGDLVKSMLKKNGMIYYWLWTYGDRHDPLGRGGFPEFLWNGKNNFWNRFRFSALRNARFTIYNLNFRSGDIVDEIVVDDSRDFSTYHVSKGIEDRPEGLYFKWMKDDKGKYHILYESVSRKQIFYFGYVGITDTCRSGRLEWSYRKPIKSYKK